MRTSRDGIKKAKEEGKYKGRTPTARRKATGQGIPMFSAGSWAGIDHHEGLDQLIVGRYANSASQFGSAEWRIGRSGAGKLEASGHHEAAESECQIALGS